MEQAIAELDRVPTGLDAELGPERPVQAVVLAERAVAVTRGHELPHQLQVRPLVAGIDGDDVLPPLQQREDTDVELPQPVTGGRRPVLVDVVGQKVAPVEPRRLGRPLGVGAGDRLRGRLLELDGVDGHVDVREELHHVATEHDGPG